MILVRVDGTFGRHHVKRGDADIAQGLDSPTVVPISLSKALGKVGPPYLLALLTAGEPRGLPSMVIDRIELQRASEGRPLDDVIVHAHDASGTAAVLEIQVKREVAFSPGDDVFRDVVQQIAAAARPPDFWTTRYELAVATAKTSARIAGPYQDVLTWAGIRIGRAAG